MKAKSIIVCLLVVCSLLAGAGAATAQQLPDFSTLAKNVGPSVVNISTEMAIKNPHQMMQFPKGSPFEEFFRQFFGKEFHSPRKEHALGSGVIISSDGYIATNNHVVENAQQIKVILQNSSASLPAKVIGTDPETDLALIKVDAGKSLTPLSFGDSDQAKVGQWVLAVGNPFGLDHTVTAGIISAMGRVIGEGPYDNFIQTDASINPGNSGGPLIDMNGQVVGINTAIVASGQGIGFAIPSSTAKGILAQLKEGKKIKRGFIGVEVQDLNENTAKALGLKNTAGALVASVTPGGPAAKAGIQPGDVITALNGQTVEDSHKLTMSVGAMKPGEQAFLTVWRKGQSRQVQVALGVRNPEKLTQAQGQGTERGQTEGAVLGMSLEPLSREEAQQFGLQGTGGLMVTSVDADSPADQAGIKAGDILLEVDQQPVSSVQQAQSLIDKEGKAQGVVLVLVSRQGQTMFRSIPYGK